MELTTYYCFKPTTYLHNFYLKIGKENTFLLDFYHQLSDTECF